MQETGLTAKEVTSVFINLSVPQRQVQKCTQILMNSPESIKGFPALTIDADSYIVGAQVQNAMQFHVEAGRHCLSIGKVCSLADSITFMLDMSHDYLSVIQGEPSFLPEGGGGLSQKKKIREKGTIILQNDVWLGHGVTVMPGVILRNGSAAATNAVVTKDVPPYAIVGGNPARILRYRFDEKTIAGLQKIAWWDWPKDKQTARKNDFALPAEAFVEKYLAEAEKRLANVPPAKSCAETVLFIPDVDEPFPLYPKVLAQYLGKDRPDWELLIYLPRNKSSQKNLQMIENILRNYEKCDTSVTLQTGTDLDERMLFQYADYYVTTRGLQTVHRTCLADLYGTKILFGTDDPIFPSINSTS